jgi:Seed maturation protein
MIMSKKSSTQTPKTPMTKEAASRIQSATAIKDGGQVAKDSFAAIAQRAAAKNSNDNK